MTSDQVQRQMDEYRVAIDALAAEQELMAGVCLIGKGAVGTLRPVLDEDGLRWVCDHEVEHASTVVAGLRK